MSVRPKIKVLLVDDHPGVRAGLAAIVGYQDDLELVGSAASAAEAIELFAERAPDVTVVDMSLPDHTGIELIAILHAQAPHAQFVVLTGETGGNEVTEALQAGTYAFLFKDSTSDELLSTIRNAFRDGRIGSPAARRTPDDVTIRSELTPRELVVLKWLIQGHNNSQIAREIAVTEDTVKFHVRNILGKLRVDSRGKAIAMSRLLGWVKV
jgi:DNA-binding NarL/FixJ family response regulator